MYFWGGGGGGGGEKPPPPNPKPICVLEDSLCFGMFRIKGSK